MNYQNIKPIAILLAVYNGEQYLEEQIKSLLSQTNQDWSLFIRNDNSIDSTELIIMRYSEQYPEKIIEIDKGGENLGCRGNFFKLLELVESDYYMFCDSDDVWLPEKVQKSYDFLKEKEKQYPNIPLLVHTDKVVCDENLNVITPSWWKAVKLNPDLFLKYKYVPISPVVGGATTLFNRSVREKCLPIPLFPPQHDCWVAMQSSKYGRIYSIHIPLILYRQHMANTIGAPIVPYSFNFLKFLQIYSIVKRDLEIARYFQTLGYGSRIKYFYNRFIVLIKLQWCKQFYK